MFSKPIATDFPEAGAWRARLADGTLSDAFAQSYGLLAAHGEAIRRAYQFDGTRVHDRSWRTLTAIAAADERADAAERTLDRLAEMAADVRASFAGKALAEGKTPHGRTFAGACDKLALAIHDRDANAAGVQLSDMAAQAYALETATADKDSRYRAESLECNRLRERLATAESNVAAYREQRDAEGERAKRAEALAESRLAEATEFRTRHAAAEARADRWQKACEASEGDANHIARQRNAEIGAHNECAAFIADLAPVLAALPLATLAASAEHGGKLAPLYLRAEVLAGETTGERHARHAAKAEPAK